ncbi:unnamed protein product, partial [Prunus brigantina]
AKQSLQTQHNQNPKSTHKLKRTLPPPPKEAHSRPQTKRGDGELQSNHGLEE